MRILLGVTGGIAVYKAAELTRELQRRGAEVQVVMTAGAEKFVTPLTFAALSGRQVLTSLWEPVVDEAASGEAGQFDIEHIRVAQEVDANSDARIKNIMGRSDTVSDLETLKKLKITDYRYIDVIQKGNQAKKGVIGQEVEKVYPDAVRTLSDFIPSVYAMADSVIYNKATQELTVTVPKAHDLAVGDTVRIIAGDAGTVDKLVAGVLSDDTFVLSDVEKAASKVFVFGKKVDDFRVVDYDQLFSINIGATQQLAVENQTLVQENAAIKAEDLAIEARLAALEQMIEELRKQNRRKPP